MTDTTEKQLPEGWALPPLNLCVDILDNMRIPVNSKERTKRHGDIPYYGATGQVGWIDNYIFDEELVLVGEDGAPFFDKNKNVAYIIDGKTWVNNHAHVLRAILNLTINSYLKHYLNQFDFTGFVGGTTRLKLNQSAMKTIPVKLAPLPEQKRIADKIQKLLDRVNTVKARLDKVPTILKRFRQSVLSAACSGRLTEDWREQHPDIDVSGQFSVIGIDLPVGWKTEKILHFTSKVGSGATPKGGQKVYKTSGTPLIRSQNVFIEGFTEEGLAYIEKKHADQLSNVEVNAGDVLLNITGASIGRVTVAPENMQGARVNQHVCIIRPEKLVMSTFLSSFLATPEMQDYIMKEQYGVTRQALTKGQILNFDVPVPSEIEQQEIVRRVEKLFALADKIEQRLREAQQQVDKITRSILAKAFRGELVPTEAELARLENRTYESAEQLLQRIQTENQKPVSKRKGKTQQKAKPQKAARKHSKGIYFHRGSVVSYIVDQLCDYPTFGRTQLEKIVHLTQYHVGIDLEFEFAKEAAGPFDEEIIKLESLARKQGWFLTCRRKGTYGHYYRRSHKTTEQCTKALKTLGAQKVELDRLIAIFRKMDTDQAEIFDTIYAVWNDLLIDGIAPSKSRIKKNFYAWSKEKERFSSEKICKCIEWIKKNNFVPTGNGPKIAIRNLSTADA